MAAGCALLTGCADDSDFANEPPPPVPINVAAVISSERVTISPERFGAGPIVLIVANQTKDSQTITLRGPSVEQSTGPINPRGTATLKVDLGPGSYKASTEDRDVKAAPVTVGEARASSQNELLQP